MFHLVKRRFIKVSFLLYLYVFIYEIIIYNSNVINRNSKQALAEELKSKPGKLFPLQCDLSNQNDILHVLEWVEKNLGAIDILINNAANNIDISLQSGEMEDWKKMFDVNFLGLTWMTKEALKLMKKKGRYFQNVRKSKKYASVSRMQIFRILLLFCSTGIDNGIIVNINDASWLKAPINCDRPISPAYIASKFALNFLTESLRSELAQLESNIKVIVSILLCLFLLLELLSLKFYS